jgi:hypothetical protein
MADEWLIAKDLKGSGYRPIVVLAMDFSEGAGENHDKSLREMPVSRPRFEIATSRMQV